MKLRLKNFKTLKLKQNLRQVRQWGLWIILSKCYDFKKPPVPFIDISHLSTRCPQTFLPVPVVWLPHPPAHLFPSPSSTLQLIYTGPFPLISCQIVIPCAFKHVKPKPRIIITCTYTFEPWDLYLPTLPAILWIQYYKCLDMAVCFYDFTVVNKSQKPSFLPGLSAFGSLTCCLVLTHMTTRVGGTNACLEWTV